jgi:hypothetical protein
MGSLVLVGVAAGRAAESNQTTAPAGERTDATRTPARDPVPMRAVSSRSTRRLLLAALAGVLVLCAAAPAPASGGPRYDVPDGFRRCPHVGAENGFFKWASVRHTTCRRGGALVRAYAAAMARTELPRRVRGYRCRIRVWRNADGDIYASRQVCARGRVVVRFYGMV